MLFHDTDIRALDYRGGGAEATFDSFRGEFAAREVPGVLAALPLRKTEEVNGTCTGYSLHRLEDAHVASAHVIMFIQLFRRS